MKKKKTIKKVSHDQGKSKAVTSRKKPQKTPAEQAIFPVVGIGASAGGLEAITLLLKHLPVNTGMAFVFIQHLAPKHVSMLDEILSRTTKMRVQTPRNDVQVQPDTLYVIPHDKDIYIVNNKFKLTKPAKVRGQHMPIDTFFKSLAEDQGENSIGIILSGTASDGVRGLQEIKSAGGITFAQSEETAKYTGMPRSARVAGCVDLIASPGGIAKELVRISRHPYLKYPKVSGESDTFIEKTGGLDEVFLLIRNATGVDFKCYKHATVKRRIRRRMMLRKFENLDDYTEELRKNTNEIIALYEDMLITVTSFFREPKVYEALMEKIFPEILKSSLPNEPIRIWVPGCSTGEEAYSIAITFLEVLGKNIKGKQIQVFATDISDRAIDKARAGIYPETIKANVSSERLRRFFIKAERGYRVNKSVREMCIFAKHNVLTDPPFSNIDFVSCRNLLIYLSSILQKKIIPMFHYALKPKGVLLLGASEGISGFTTLFTLVDKKNKICLKKNVAIHLDYGFTSTYYPSLSREAEIIEDKRILKITDVQDSASQILLDKYVPTSILVTDNREILRFWGQSSPYIQHDTGKASLNLMKLIHKDLSMDVRVALREADSKKIGIKKKNIRFNYNGQDRYVDIEVIKVKAGQTEDKTFLILFEEVVSGGKGVAKEGAEPARKKRKGISEDQKEIELAHTQEELEKTREYLQSVIEGQETINEELKSSLEELQSSNEELQSTNEELETAKEELQSTNEELSTVNEELENRNIEIDKINNDLINLFGGVDIAIIMLGEDLCIRRFNATAQKVMKFIPGDVGRKFTDINPTVDIPNAKKMILDVMDSLKMKEIEIQDTNGKWFSARIRPYVTQDKKIEGVVITVVDIDVAKKASAEVEIVAKFPEEDPAPVLRVEKNGELLYANKAAGIILKKWKTGIGERVPEKWGKFVKDAIKLGGNRTEEEEIENAVFSFFIAPISGTGYANLYGTDITERKKMEQMRNTLLRDVSHSLKTPIAIAKMAQDMCARGIESGDTVRIKEAQEMAQESINEAHRDIDSMMEFFALDSIKGAEFKKSISLRKVTEEIMRGVKYISKAKKLKIKTAISEDADMILASEEEIKMLFSNVIDNAVKFTDEGDISVSAKSSGKMVKIKVKDTGCGIAEKDKDKIFEKFYQRHASVDGVGLGMSICKEIVKRHNGRIEVFSKGVGKGTTVTISLPRK